MINKNKVVYTLSGFVLEYSSFHLRAFSFQLEPPEFGLNYSSSENDSTGILILLGFSLKSVCSESKGAE